VTDPRQRRQFFAVVLGVSLIFLAVLAHRASIDRFDPDGQVAAPAARVAVQQRATSLAAMAMSYDAASASRDIARVERFMTADMRAEYERTLPDAAARQKQSDTGVKVVAKVTRAGVMSLTKDKATVLVFVNQRASAKSTKKVLESPTWEILRLVRSGADNGGDWLLSGMEAP
jgi:Mce-associated membrane protein